ncbi:MAG: hypothetical protein IPG00_22165 [Saprospiraceae bacterium]|nr:hypothetical protein [Saprospiraceae bacterium]
MPYAGMDISRSYCDGDTSISLANLPEESADQGGTFYDADFNTLDHLKDINAPIDDIIYYETSNGICYDTAQISLSIKPVPSISKVEDAAICFDDRYIADINVENNTTLTWFDGLIDSLRIFTEAGIYSYQIANQYGCTLLIHSPYRSCHLPSTRLFIHSFAQDKHIPIWAKSMLYLVIIWIHLGVTKVVTVYISSWILCHSLSYPWLLKEILMLVREILQIS